MAYVQIPWESRLNPRFAEDVRKMKNYGTDDKEVMDKCEELIQENNSFYPTVDVKAVIDRMHGIELEIRKKLVNRREITQQGIRALMSGEHQFIFSSAGVAKSLYANQMFSFFKNSNVFAMQFCPDTTPDDLFGAYDIARFKKGEVYHNVEGSIITNNFAFLDEFMDGNDKLLRSLLGVLLERKFISGNQVEEAILHTAIATSNYMRVTETTEALLDRFLYKSFILPQKDMFNLLKIDRVYNENAGRVTEPDPDSQIELRELVYLRRIIKGIIPEKKITIPIEVDYLKNMVVVAFEEEMKKYRENYYLSPRTISKSNDLLKANALYNHRMIVEEKDVESLYYLICTLNEPITEDRSLISQDLFKKVYQKRLQFYHSIKNEVVPLLYIFEFLCEAELKPQILKDTIPFLEKLAKHSLMEDLVDKLRNIFSSVEDQKLDQNKTDLLKYIESVKSDYREISIFKTRLLQFTKEVFQKIGH